jgi:hypothetical protein
LEKVTEILGSLGNFLKLPSEKSSNLVTLKGAVIDSMGAVSVESISSSELFIFPFEVQTKSNCRQQPFSRHDR